MTLTFWEGLELVALRQVELLQVVELTCACKTIAQSANSTVPLRAEARSIRGTRLTFRQGLDVTAAQVELCEGGDTAEHSVGLLCTIQRRPAQRQLLKLQFSERCDNPNQPTEAFGHPMTEGETYFLGGTGASHNA